MNDACQLTSLSRTAILRLLEADRFPQKGLGTGRRFTSTGRRSGNGSTAAGRGKARTGGWSPDRLTTSPCLPNLVILSREVFGVAPTSTEHNNIKKSLRLGAGQNSKN